MSNFKTFYIMSKVRPTYVQQIVDNANTYLRALKVTDEGDNLFRFVCDYLLKKDMYEGFSHFKDKYNPYSQKNIAVLAGSCKEGEFEYLQIL